VQRVESLGTRRSALRVVVVVIGGDGCCTRVVDASRRPNAKEHVEHSH
jgi:hypothetical protein